MSEPNPTAPADSAGLPSGSAAALDPVDYAISARIAAGDESAFAEFYEAWFAPTLSLARAISRRDEGWCLDVVQDVMLTVARKMPGLASQAALRAWMTRTVARAVTDRARADARRRRREQVVADASRQLVGDPWQDLCDQERLSWLSASLAKLSAADQTLLAARYGDACSVTAAAAALGLSSDQAHGRLRRALHRLREQAARWWSSERPDPGPSDSGPSDLGPSDLGQGRAQQDKTN